MTLRRLAIAAATLVALLACAPLAAAQEDAPDAGQNEFFFHGDKATGPFFDGVAPTSPAPRTQDSEPVANPDFPENPLAAYWSQSDDADFVIAPAAINDKEMVLRWFFSSPDAAGVLAGVPVAVTVFAIPQVGDEKIIGKVNTELVVGATPTINETTVLITEPYATGERIVVQVTPTGPDTGVGLQAVYDSTDFPSGFSLRDPPPGAGEELPEGVDGLASADPQGLAFSASLPADPQRDESEPNIEIDGDGNIYTCGPTGVSQGADYAQVSRDGGNQFHLLGEPPRGQQAFGGGGDCGLATAPERNEEGHFTYAYSGLGPLTNFATSSSQDVGQEMRSSPSSQSVPGVDRQWHTFLDADSVLLSYNQQQPRQVVVQRSDDGGVNYGPSVPATFNNPRFPGPLHHLPASVNPDGEDAGRVPYFSFNFGNDIFLAVSTDEGATWHNCKVATAAGTAALFPTADNDRAGNIYVAYSENHDFHTWLTVLPVGKLGTCLAPGSEISPVKGAQLDVPDVEADVLPAIQMDRDAVRSTVFAWVTAGGAPGRVAVSFYGSETNGDPNMGPSEDNQGKPIGFRGSWDVYVSQSLDALDAAPEVAQVKATTHPFHYDSICLNGTACAVTLGDRSLADFFALDFNPKRHSLHLVYNQGYKRPDDDAGVLATPAVISQIAGPTLDGEPIDPAQGPPLANHRDDPGGDAITDYSRVCLQTDATCPPKPAAGENQPGADIRSVTIGPETNLESGAEVPDGGFDVTMKVGDLSDEALQKALDDQRANALIFAFRWINGFRSAAAVARWTPGDGFRFGFNDFVIAGASCGPTVCLTYPGDEEIPGKVSVAGGTITLAVPRSKLKGLEGPTGANQRPKEVAAGADTRFYDGTAFALAALVTADDDEQSFLYPFDNAPSMDFLVGGKLPAPEQPAGGGPPPVVPVPDSPPQTPSGPPAPGCQEVRHFRSASARPRGRRVQLSFRTAQALASSTEGVSIDVFQTSRGRRVLKERLVARFRDPTGPFVWNGVSNRRGRRVTDGWFFVRYRLKGDVRRVVLRRRHGRWSRRPTFHRRRSCLGLRLFKLRRPVFGGRRNSSLGIAYRLTEPGTVRLDVLRGKKVVKRFRTRQIAAGRTVRQSLRARGLRRGDYRVRIRVRGAQSVRAILTSHRL